MEERVVEVDTTISAQPARVWEVITDGTSMMPGTTVESSWKRGAPITFSGEWNGKPFKDYGEILELEPERLVAYSHWSKTPQRPADYHIVRYELEPALNGTVVRLSQTNVGASPQIDDATRAEFTKNWTMMLEALKKAAEA